MHRPQAIEWSEQEFSEVRPGIFGSTIHTPQLTATLYRYTAGSSWEEHRHPEDQVTMVLEGVIEFVVEGRSVRLEQGQMAALPGGTLHSATVPLDAAAVSINVFTRRETTPP